MTADEIRNAFLSYFESKDHKVHASASLLTHDDPTLLFVNAGMVPFKNVFTGAEEAVSPRAASSQACLRVSGKHNDLENVGRTARHHTLFEMLGNFSFGDYFKAEAIPFAWELLTEVWKLDADRLWVTVYKDDDEAYALWRDQVGVPEARIQRLGEKDNFWSMGDVGPCGPCSEIHYDHGAKISSDTRGPAGEDDRYVEIWNLVFMQYEQHKDGSRTGLPKPSIDTGMGLERIAAVKQGVYWNYDTDLFQPLIARAADTAGVRYGEHADSDTALRVISDHARATAFLISDGVMPGNEGRAYVLRRIMRRALRFGWKLGISDAFFHKVTDEVVQRYQDAHPRLAPRREFISEVVLAEEQRFSRTIDRGMALVEEELTVAKASSRPVAGDAAFKLWDTYGFPLDLTEQIAEEHGVAVDGAGFEKAMAAQKERGRAAALPVHAAAVQTLWKELAEELGATDFTGYTELSRPGNVVALFRKSGEELHRVERLDGDETGIVLLDRTPFYGESGGQAGDSGRLSYWRVTDTTKSNGLHLHHVEGGEAVSVGDVLEARVDVPSRDGTRRNHTGTHLLHAALRSVLGEHVTQKGSLVAPDRLRFDFAHHKPVTAEELRQIEDLVNAEVLANKPVETTVDDLEAAVAKGAMALFGEKYDDRVRVVSVPGFSVELCGGTHVSRTGDIGPFVVVSEAGIASGVRRIEAQTGTGALAVFRKQAEKLAETASFLKTQADRVPEAVAKLAEERKGVEKELAELKREVAQAAAGGLVSQAREIGGIKVLAARFDGDLKEQADRLRDQLGTSLVVLASDRGDKAQLIVAASKDVAGKQLHAGNLVKQLAPMIGGGGGGRPDMAQAGGKDPSGIDGMLSRAYELASEALA